MALGLIFVFYYSIRYKSIVNFLEIEVIDVFNRIASVRL